MLKKMKCIHCGNIINFENMNSLKCRRTMCDSCGKSFRVSFKKSFYLFLVVELVVGSYVLNSIDYQMSAFVITIIALFLNTHFIGWFFIELIKDDSGQANGS